MGTPRLFSVVGRKHAGKTTLISALAAEYARRGLRVMTLKHGHREGPLDEPGTDTHRHLTEGRAVRTLLAGPQGRRIVEPAEDLYDPVALARTYLADADLVLVEGYKRAEIPKVEVWRKGLGEGPIFDAASPLAGQWIAIATDDDAFAAEGPAVFRFRDTMWLHLLAQTALERALPLG